MNNELNFPSNFERCGKRTSPLPGVAMLELFSAEVSSAQRSGPLTQDNCTTLERAMTYSPPSKCQFFMLAENKARQTARLGGKLSALGIGEMEKIQYYYTENGRLLTTFGVKFRSFLSGWRWRSRGESERVPRACAREIRACIVVGVRVLREHGRVSASCAGTPRAQPGGMV